MGKPELVRPRKVVLASLLLPLTACSLDSNTCQDDFISSKDSPDKKHRAMLFQRDCGATTGFTTQVTMMKMTSSGMLEFGIKPVFIPDDDHGRARAGSWGGPWINMQWLGNDRLKIRYAAGSRIFARHSEDEDVQIDYEAVAVR